MLCYCVVSNCVLHSGKSIILQLYLYDSFCQRDQEKTRRINLLHPLQTILQPLASAYGLAKHRDGRWEWAIAPGVSPSPRYQHAAVSFLFELPRGIMASSM